MQIRTYCNNICDNKLYSFIAALCVFSQQAFIENFGWHSWKIAELALSNNHSLTPFEFNIYQLLQSTNTITPASIRSSRTTFSSSLVKHAELDFYSGSSLKQQSAGRHVALLGHIILIPSQPVFALSPKCCVLSGEATNTNFIVFGLTRSVIERKCKSCPF
jgi:hypothetical protein